MNKNGFSFVEILLTLVILGIVVLPLMRMYSSSLEHINANKENIVAFNLARMEMEKTRNANFTINQFKIQPDKKYTINVNNVDWLVERVIFREKQPLPVQIRVYRKDEPTDPKIIVTTLLEDLE
ncbi:MAG: prepilin-type N-terminal cleavage/methylation domain-containing protein [Candidatus Gygaella obscura]|nr:prepilin-type N-terminal cleavage/methylation domain-containing protein [Candidatus Gygaella obscura]